MSQAAEGRMRLTVLGGYLGSGKTTWLRHQLHEGRFDDAHVIVNEAAETPVDDALLGQSQRLSVLAGGCVCCTAKADLIELLRQLCDERSNTASDQRRLGQIVLETSGLADPGPIVASIKSDPMLAHHIVVSEIIVVVDALNALSQLKTEPLGRRQIETADRLIVAKPDVSGQGDIKTLLATLAQLNPGAGMSGAAMGIEVPLPDFTAAVPEPLPDLTGEPERPPILPARLFIDDTIDWTAFTVWLSALLHARGEDIVRVKGVVRTPAGRLLLQAVRKNVQSPEIMPEQADMREDNMIAVIGRGFTPDQLKRSLKHFAGR